MKIIKYTSVGLAIGFVVTTLSLVLILGFNEITEQVFAWLIASAVYGISALVFEIQSLKTLYLSIIHYAICACVTAVNIALFYSEYLMTVFVSFTVIYAVVYLLMWLGERRKIKLLNDKLSGR